MVPRADPPPRDSPSKASAEPSGCWTHIPPFGENPWERFCCYCGKAQGCWYPRRSASRPLLLQGGLPASALPPPLIGEGRRRRRVGGWSVSAELPIWTGQLRHWKGACTRLPRAHLGEGCPQSPPPPQLGNPGGETPAVLHVVQRALLKVSFPAPHQIWGWSWEPLVLLTPPPQHKPSEKAGGGAGSRCH